MFFKYNLNTMIPVFSLIIPVFLKIIPVSLHILPVHFFIKPLVFALFVNLLTDLRKENGLPLLAALDVHHSGVWVICLAESARCPIITG